MLTFILSYCRVSVHCPHPLLRLGWPQAYYLTAYGEDEEYIAFWLWLVEWSRRGFIKSEFQFKIVNFTNEQARDSLSSILVVRFLRDSSKSKYYDALSVHLTKNKFPRRALFASYCLKVCKSSWSYGENKFKPNFPLLDSAQRAPLLWINVRKIWVPTCCPLTISPPSFPSKSESLGY